MTHVGYVVDPKWDSFEIDKLVVLSSREEELKKSHIFWQVKHPEDYVYTKNEIDESFLK